MSGSQSSYTLKIADLYIHFSTLSQKIRLDANDSNITYKVKEYSKINYSFLFNVVEKFNISEYHSVFKGEPDINEYLNYKWEIFQSENNTRIVIHFDDHMDIESICATISESSNQVFVDIILKKGRDVVLVSPLIHPLGSLVLFYLVHWNNGLLIHASGVIYKKSAFLFTGVSGIGKSTMARLWKESGEEVLNDDRLVIRLIAGEVKLYNNPMPYYQQQPKQGILKKIFLLKQSTDNYLIKLSGALAYSKVLGNFIQQFYQKEIVKNHLNIIEDVLNKVEVFEVGFKPDQDIIRRIKNMDSNE